MAEFSTLDEARAAAIGAVKKAVRDGWNVIAAVGKHPTGAGYTYTAINGGHDPKFMGEILEFISPDGRRFLPVD